VVPAPEVPPTLVQEENKTGNNPAVIKRTSDVFFIFPTLACTTVTSECERLLLAGGLVYASLERSDAFKGEYTGTFLARLGGQTNLTGAAPVE
jgi:hypothetical protein